MGVHHHGLVLAVSDLIGRQGDCALDAASAQVNAIGAAGTGLVTQHPIRAGPRAPAAEPTYPDSVQDGLELWALASLPDRDPQRQRFLPLLRGEVGLGGEPAPQPAQRVIPRRL